MSAADVSSAAATASTTAQPRGRRLGAAEHAAFARDGYLAPLEAFAPAEIADARARLTALLDAAGGVPDVRLRNKPHLLYPWMHALVRDARVLDPVEDLLGPNLLIWRATLFVKPPRDPSVVSWHQDTAFWDLSAPRVVTAWVAFTDSTTDSGCVRVVAGSHQAPPPPHRLGRDRNNRLIHGELVADDVAGERVVPLQLRAGQMSLHDGRLLHGSPGNPSDGLRAGLAIRYIPPELRFRGPRQSVSLVRGVDRHGHFDLEPVPRWDLDPVARRWHARSLRRYAAQVLWQIARQPSLGHLALLARLAARRDMLRAMR